METTSCASAARRQSGSTGTPDPGCSVTVVDASVVLEWLIGRPPAASRALLDAHVAGAAPLVAPDLLHYEIGDVLVTRIALPVLELMRRRGMAAATEWLDAFHSAAY